MSLHKKMGDDFIWGLKYRPINIDELILPQRIKKHFKQIVKSKQIPNLLLSGSAGCGKTSSIIAICEMLGFEYFYINGSLDNSIDVIRTKVKTFVTSTNWDNSKKILIIDESDRMSVPALESMKVNIEEFSRGCSFIFISNHKNKIIPPLISRLQTIDFIFTTSEKNEMKKEFFKRCCEILDKEEIEFDKKVVANLIQKHFPDMRKCLNELQKFSQQENLNDQSSINNILIDENEIYEILKEKNYNKIKNFVMSSSSDPQTFYSKIFDTCHSRIEPEDLPSFIMLLSKYLYESAFVADYRINMMAFMLQSSMECKIKLEL